MVKKTAARVACSCKVDGCSHLGDALDFIPSLGLDLEEEREDERPREFQRVQFFLDGKEKQRLQSSDLAGIRARFSCSEEILIKTPSRCCGPLVASSKKAKLYCPTISVECFGFFHLPYFLPLFR